MPSVGVILRSDVRDRAIRDPSPSLRTLFGDASQRFCEARGGFVYAIDREPCASGRPERSEASQMPRWVRLCNSAYTIALSQRRRRLLWASQPQDSIFLPVLNPRPCRDVVPPSFKERGPGLPAPEGRSRIQSWGPSPASHDSRQTGERESRQARLREDEE